MYNLQSFIANVAPVGELYLTTGGPASTCLSSKLIITQFLFHFSSKDISQLINGIFSTLQKLPKYFNDIANSISWYHFYLHHNHEHLHLHYKYYLLFCFYI